MKNWQPNLPCTIDIHRFAVTMLRRRFYDAQDGQCGICRARMKRNFNSPKLSFDHVWPKAWIANDYGSLATFLGNLLLTHAQCNRKKDADRPSEDQIAFLYEINRKLGLMPHETALWDQPEEAPQQAATG